MNLFSIKNVFAGHGDMKVLFGISGELSKGKCIGILGRNGVGKTTLLRTLAGEIPAIEGEILYKNQKITPDNRKHAIANGLIYIPDNRGIFPNLSVKENFHISIHLCKKLRGNSTDSASRLQPIFQLFPQLEQRLHHSCSVLSGGELQMLAIARGLLMQPELLIIDEPAEGLSPIYVSAIENAILYLKNMGTTIIIAEQQRQFIRNICDEVMILGQGKIQFNGTVQQLEKDNKTTSKWLGPYFLKPKIGQDSVYKRLSKMGPKNPVIMDLDLF